MTDDNKDNTKESILEPKETSSEEAKRPSNLMIYIPVVVFVVIVVVVGFILMRGGSGNAQLTTEQQTDQTLFREGALAERKNVILITDFTKN